MKLIREFIKWYVYITFGVLVIVALSCTTAEIEFVKTYTLWQILIASFLTSVVTTIMHSGHEEGLVKCLPRMFLHYALLCIVMVVCGMMFDWISQSIGGILFMMGAVAAVYVITLGIFSLLDWRAANNINQRLKEMYPDDGEENTEGKN